MILHNNQRSSLIITSTGIQQRETSPLLNTSGNKTPAIIFLFIFSFIVNYSFQGTCFPKARKSLNFTTNIQTYYAMTNKISIFVSDNG